MLLEIQSNKDKTTGILSLAGVLDISTVDAFNNSLDYFYDVKELIIDFAKIKFIDSTGIGGVVQAIKYCQKQKIALKITNISEEVFEILNILGLPEIFGNEIFEVIP